MRPFLRALLRRRPTFPSPAPLPQNRTVRISATMTASSTVAAALYTCAFSPAVDADSAPADAKTKPHHAKTGKGFVNPWDSWAVVGGMEIARTMISRRFSGAANVPDTTTQTIPVVTPTFLPTRTGSPHLRATWLGHACYYLEFPSGLRVLFDPVFESRCSPFSFMGPKRYTPAPCAVADIPLVDLVVISHSHYDHLSHPTILALHAAHPNALFAVPLGLKQWFTDSGVKNVVELDWWQDLDITLSPAATGESRVSAVPASAAPPADAITARLSCLPCQHTSARTPFDHAHTLWASWAVASGGKSAWFGGDTGYRAVPLVPAGVDDYSAPYASLPRCPAFADIGSRKGPFDLGLIPIGAYEPRHLFSSMHANPFDSVEIFKDTRCARAMAIHWGTWVLTEEDVMEPPRLLREALKRGGLEEEGVFDVCDVGESREF